jgi:hypothetical protein
VALKDTHGARVRELADAGKGRNEIAAELGISLGSVTSIAAAIGVSFDRSMTAQAVAARSIDCKLLRTELAIKLLRKANQLIDDMDGKFLAFSFGGRDNTYNEHQMDRPPTQDIRNLMIAASTAISRHIDLEKVDSDSGVGHERSLLSQLGAALGVSGPPTA